MYKFSECVSPGHPDKVADLISQEILNNYIKKDPDVRYAVEVMIKGNNVYLAGEVTSSANFNILHYSAFVLDALKKIGYTAEYVEKWGEFNVIDPSAIKVVSNIQEQSPEIGAGVNKDAWGDQGIFFGYADVKGKFFLPKSQAYAKSLCHMLYEQAKNENIGGIDIKTEVIVDENDNIVKIIAAVPAKNSLEEEMILESIKNWHNEIDSRNTAEIILNGTGSYTMHGPMADCGVTGRKLAVDFYGGEFQVGGGNTSGKDASKSDVTLNLYARKLAIKYAIENGCSTRVALACCIGRDEVNYTISDECGAEIKSGVITLKPSVLKEELGLNEPIYFSMHTFGLFGEFQTDKAWEKW